MKSTQSNIIQMWDRLSIPGKLPVKSAKPLEEKNMTILKDGKTRDVWKIDVPSSDGTFPVVLKRFNGTKTFRKHYEWNVFNNLKDTPVSQFLPEIYHIHTDVENQEVWIFLEYMEVIGERPNVTFTDLKNMVSSLAKLHAVTFEHQPIASLIKRTIPELHNNKRIERLSKMRLYLQQAKEDSILSEIINKYCPKIYKHAESNLNFSEVIDSGQCMTHQDLHLGNICYSDDNTIKFIDFGAATFAPCWLDLVKLVESIIDNRLEGDEEIRKKCIRIYVKVMEKQGITFSTDPYRLYRMAYIMRVFEKELRRNIKATLRGKRPFVSQKVLEKISLFSEELNLI